MFIAVASADDGSYRPEYQGGAYSHQSGAYRRENIGKYYHGVVPTPRPVFRVAPSRFVPSVAVRVPITAPFVRVQPVAPEGHWQTLRDIREQSPAGDYHYEFETQNGIHARQQSQVIAPESQRATGFYEYKSPEGENIRVDYIADENGFQPTGAHLPVAPPVPAAIARAVEYLLRNARPQ